VIFAGTEGYLDDLPLEKISDFEPEFLEYMEAQHSDILQEIKQEKKLSDGLKKKLGQALEHFLESFHIEEMKSEDQAE
jgi:F-type H+-transporting ATPase subunit alpha